MSSTLQHASGKLALTGRGAQAPAGAPPPQLACVCALCVCGRHACPACYVPGATFAGQSTYREHFGGAELPPCVEDSRAWAPNPPAPSPFLQTEHTRNFVGHPVTGAFQGQSLGLARTEHARNVPFMGRSTYRTFHEDRVRRADPAELAPPTILRAPLLPVASAVPLLGVTQQARAHQPFRHLPETGFVMPESVHRAPPPPIGEAFFEGEGSHAVHYPPRAVDYATSRPASFKPHQTAASSARFEGASHSNSTHAPLDASGVSGPVRVPKTFVAIDETRDFETQASADYPPRQLQRDTTCPAARLGRPPSPSAAPNAWAGEHVLYDVGTRKWAV